VAADSVRGVLAAEAGRRLCCCWQVLPETVSGLPPLLVISWMPLTLVPLFPFFPLLPSPRSYRRDPR
jgi:hypothetical protein